MSTLRNKKKIKKINNNLTEAALANQRQEQVALVERRVVLEPRVILIVYALELANVQVALPLQLLQLRLQVHLLLLQRRLPQPQDLVLLIPVLDGHRLRVGLDEHVRVVAQLGALARGRARAPAVVGGGRRVGRDRRRHRGRGARRDYLQRDDIAISNRQQKLLELLGDTESGVANKIS